jgi:uncharacterized protein (DUF488 family)
MPLLKSKYDHPLLPRQNRPEATQKGALTEALHEVGIAYAHLRALGCPKPIRDRYKTEGDWEAYKKAFLAHLGGQREAVAELARIASKTNCCLVCFEADFNRCHRTYVGRAAARIEGLRLIHLTEQIAIPDVGARTAA